MDDISLAVAKLKSAQRISIIAHARPDGDAYGSLLGLGLCLKALGKEVHMFNEDGLTGTYSFIPGGDLIEKTPATPPDYDLLVSVDTSTAERLGTTFQQWKRTPDLSFDHHVSNTRFAPLNIVRPDLPAASCLILEIIEAYSLPLTQDIATCLYVGISTDTGSFRYRGTTNETLSSAARLITAGADPAWIAQKCYQSTPLEKFHLFRLGLASAQLECSNTLAYLQLTPEIFSQSGARPEHTEGLVERLLEILPVRISAVFENPKPNILRVSLRAKEGIDVSALASEFGGGGHPLAAGIRIEGSPEDNKQRILARLRAALKNS